MNQHDIESLYKDEFPALLANEWKPWRQSYLAFVNRVQSASHAEWLTPAFQQSLWESTDLGSVGMGNSVVVATAYADTALAEALWQARNRKLPSDLSQRAEVITGVFDEIVGLVTPKHNKRRPSAKMVRALAGIFPLDLLCLLDDYKTNRVRQELGFKKHGDRFLKQHLLIRAELARVVGAEAPTVEGAIERSMFAWLLWEKSAQVEEDKSSSGAAAVVSSPTTLTAGPPEAPALRLWPREKQWAGVVHVKNALHLLLALVRDAEHGATREDLIANVQDAASYLSASSAGKQVALAKGPFGVLELRDGGVIKPTQLGRELLEGESVSDVLAPVLIRRVWGVAQVLDILRGLPDGVERAALIAKLTARHGKWTTEMAASSILEWCKDIDLVESSKPASGQTSYWLTDAGLQWAGRVPADLGAWDVQAEANEEIVEDSSAPVPVAESVIRAFLPAEFPAIAAAFASDKEHGQLVLPDNLLALLHGALHSLEHKRFVLLSGLSGTGKTSLAEAYARAYCAARKLPAQTHMARIPVSPDWSDPSGLLGYVSPLGDQPRFQGTQALEFILLAAQRPEEPFFLCLDEMNLARVEHYFAPFLSAMEGTRSQLVIHGSRDMVDNVPSTIPWPKNLFIIGTVNMDETTHAFSDKVLDRAFSFELWHVDLDAWGKAAGARGAAAEVLDKILGPLRELHAALQPARRHFGYRTCDEVLGFYAAVPEGARGVALDAAVLAKVLPKVRGDDSGPLPAALDKARAVCEAHGLKQSAAKLGAMIESLKSLGVVRFAS